MEQYAKGEFDYETPTLILSEEKIEIAVEAGKSYSNTFMVTNQEKARMKGVLYSSSRRFHIEETQFIGSEIVLHYTYHADHMVAGEKEEGYMTVISDVGEFSVPFIVTITAPMCKSAEGTIKSLFQFTELCKKNWPEGVALFQSREFETVLLAGEQERYRVLYQNLVKGRSSDGALEEFLIAIHKKEKITFRISNQNLQYKISARQYTMSVLEDKHKETESFLDSIIITKDHWGYGELNVHTDATFLRMKATTITTDNFVGNQYPLEFVVLPSALKYGKNYGTIYIETIGQSISIPVECEVERIPSMEAIEEKKKKRYQSKLMETYINLRCKKINLEQYVSDSKELISMILNNTEDERYHLLELHLLMISKEERKVKQRLEAYEEQLDQLLEVNPIVYCGVLYLKALVYNEEATIESCCDNIQRVYEGGQKETLILWFLLNLDKRYMRNRERALEDMREQYQQQGNTPVLYYEAMRLLNEEPSLLRSLGSFEVHVLNFGIKYELVSEDVANQYAYLATKERYFQRLIYLGLERLYERYQTKDLLIAICTMLIRGHMRAPKYFKWFQLGVQAQIRVTELHEYYMYTIDEHSKEKLPQPILLYFIYNSSLNDKKRAYLYARIVKEKETNGSIYRTYAKKIEQFAKRQLEHYKMNENLAILYNDLAQEGQLSQEEIDMLYKVSYQYEVICHNPNMKGIYVVYEELEQEEYVSLVDQRAYVELVSEHVGLYFVDSKEQRYVSSVEYTIKRILPETSKILELFGDTTMNNYNKMQKLIREGYVLEETEVEYLRNLCVAPEIKQSHQNQMMEQMIYYCKEHRCFEALEYYLRLIDVGLLTKAGRNKVLTIMMEQEEYQRVLPHIQEYGYEELNILSLLKLCQRLIANVDITLEETELTHLCFYLFQSGRREEDIIQYLADHYIGASSQMYRIWQCARKDNISAHKLEEQLLAQTLFSQGMLEHQVEVFLSFYQYNPRHTLCKAYLNYYAFRTIMYDDVLKYEILQCMKFMLDTGDNLLCSLGLLKNYTYQLNQIVEEEKAFIKEQLELVIKHGYMLPCFKNLSSLIPLPNEINEKQYVEFHANPNKLVKLYYRILKNKDQEVEYAVETMTPSIFGVYVRSFVLFYDEELEYCFSQEIEGTHQMTARMRLGCPKEAREDTALSTYGRINRMLRLYEAKEVDQLTEEMEEYMKQEYLICQHFKSL